MVIIPHGWFTSKFYSSRPKDIICFECGCKGQMSVEKFVLTPHVFYVPLFPAKIYSEVGCVVCGINMKYSEMDQVLKRQYNPFKSKKLPPFWAFSGILLVLALFGVVYFNDIKERYVNLERFENPEVGRIIEYETDHNSYSAMKIYKVDDSMIYVFMDRYEVDSYDAINKILDKGHFSNDTIAFHRNQIESWIKSGKVKSIHW